MVLVTDEIIGYTIWNYRELQWTAHTEAGGDTTGGEGGVPAYVSLNLTRHNPITLYTIEYKFKHLYY